MFWLFLASSGGQTATAGWGSATFMLTQGCMCFGSLARASYKAGWKMEDGLWMKKLELTSVVVLL